MATNHDWLSRLTPLCTVTLALRGSPQRSLVRAPPQHGASKARGHGLRPGNHGRAPYHLGRGSVPFRVGRCAQCMHFFGNGFQRIMKSYDEFLSPQEYDNMVNGRTVTTAVRKYETNIRGQVIYPTRCVFCCLPPFLNSNMI